MDFNRYDIVYRDMVHYSILYIANENQYITFY